MLKPIFTRPLTRQLFGNLRYIRPVRTTSSSGVFPRTSPRRSSDFSRNSSTGKSYSATELDVVDFSKRRAGPRSSTQPPFSYPTYYWGFVVIRTIYTPESDLQWPIAMAKLNDWLRLELKSMSDASVPDQDYVIKMFKNLVADDKTLYDGLPMSDAVLRFEDILEEQFNVTLKYSSPEHFYKTWQYRIPELVEQSLIESDPEVKRDLLQASYWCLNGYICLVIDEEVLKDLVELPCLMPPPFDLARALKAIRENPDGPPPIIDEEVYLKVAMRHPEFDLMSRRLGYTAENPDWYAQWAKWDICNGLGHMHRSIRSCVLGDGGMELELRDGEPYVEIYGQD